MRGLSLLPLLVLPVVRSAPSNELQAVLAELGAGYTDLAGAVVGKVAEGVAHLAQDVEEAIEGWMHDGHEFVQQNGLTCECASRG
jgi:hypothetical protein